MRCYWPPGNGDPINPLASQTRNEAFILYQKYLSFSISLSFIYVINVLKTTPCEKNEKLKQNVEKSILQFELTPSVSGLEWYV